MTEPAEIDPVVAENQRLRRALYAMVAERNKAATKLTGVQNLGQQLQKKEQENTFLKEKLERLEGTLARAENRITQLSLQAGNGAHQAFSRGGIVTPGVSKKLLEALTRENTRLKLALEHIIAKGSNGNGSDLAVENRELHEIIMSLREDRDQKINEADELKRALAAVQDENVDVLKNQVIILTKTVTKLERNLSAKQVFSESVVTENEHLKEMMHLPKNEKITEVSTLKRELGDLTKTQPDVRKILSEVDVGEDGADGYTQESQNAEHTEILLRKGDSLGQQCEKYKKQIEELQRKADEIPILKREVDTKTAELRTFQLHNEENEKECRKLVEEQETLKEELDNIRRQLERKERELDELKIVHNLMQESLANYEHDFKIEREEKMKAVSDRDKLLRERDQIVHHYEQLKREHITLRQNIERMYSQAQQQTQPPRRQLSGGRQTCGAQIQEPWQQQTEMRARGFGMEACADGPGDFTDAPTALPKETPTPAGSRRYSSQGSQLQCPYCRKNFPHDLLENHMRDCTGDD